MSNSSQLIILGNGFDLHCGLQSSYRDFFRTTLLDTTIESFGIKKMKINDAGFWEKLLFEYHSIYGNQDYKWCDIEKIIKSTLLLIYYGEENSQSNMENGLFGNALNFIKEQRDISDEQLYNDDPIKKYIFTYCVIFLERIEIREKSFFEKLHLLSLHLLQDLNLLENRFCNYLKINLASPNCTNKINEKYLIAADNLLMNIIGYPDYKINSLRDIIHMDLGEKHTETPLGTKIEMVYKNYLSNSYLIPNNTYILSFNYTNLFDSLDVQNPCAFNNVHGKLCNQHCSIPCGSSNIIFGIDDTLIQSHDKNSYLRLFSKTYRKMLSSSVPTKILPSNNNAPVIIKFYGHSLSEADYSYFQSIFDYYNLYSNSNISLIFYYSKGFEQNDEIYQLINSYGKTLPNENQGNNLMHKLILENRITIEEIP